MNAHSIARKAQSFGHLIWKFGHLNGSPNIQNTRRVVPLAGHCKGFNGNGGIARPTDAVAQLVVAFRKIIVDRAPHKMPVKYHIAAMRRMDQGGIGQQGFLRVNHGWKLFVVDHHQLCCIFCQGATVSHNGCHPLASVARDVKCQRVTCDLGRIDARQHGLGMLAKLLTG